MRFVHFVFIVCVSLGWNVCIYMLRIVLCYVTMLILCDYCFLVFTLYFYEDNTPIYQFQGNHLCLSMPMRELQSDRSPFWGSWHETVLESLLSMRHVFSDSYSPPPPEGKIHRSLSPSEFGSSVLFVNLRHPVVRLAILSVWYIRLQIKMIVIRFCIFIFLPFFVLLEKNKYV